MLMIIPAHPLVRPFWARIREFGITPGFDSELILFVRGEIQKCDWNPKNGLPQLSLVWKFLVCKTAGGALWLECELL